MTRALALAVLATLVGALAWLPAPDPVRLAANAAGELLREPAVGDAADGRPLWRHLVESSAAERAADGTLELRVRGYRMQLGGSLRADQRLHARLYESFQRSLRSIAAEEGLSLAFRERSRADFPGLLILGALLEGGLAVEVHLPDDSVLGARADWAPPGNLTLVPPLLAVLLAILLRRPLVALAAGVVAGALLERWMYAGAAWAGAGRLVTHYLPGELFEPTRLAVAAFLVCMLALVGVVTRAGGMRGVVELLARRARDARGAQVATFLVGLFVLFDHYASTLLVGTTMRPLTDRFRVSREKLAYLVDSTAAPVAGLSIFSTWIAFEVSTVQAHLPAAGMASAQGYELFLSTLPYRFYSLFTLLLVALFAFTGRDFGPMLRAERRARRGELVREGARPLASIDPAASRVIEGAEPRARAALVPLAVLVATTLVAILWRGGAFDPGTGLFARFSQGRLRDVLLAGSGAAPLAVGAAAGLAAALLAAAGVLAPRSIVAAAAGGLRTAVVPLALLYLSWMLGTLCLDLGTADYLCARVQEALNPLALPVVLFLLAGGISFSTGSPWSTMTILLPLVVGLAFELGKSTPLGSTGMLVVTIASVLEGAIFGDHCSPISDTTVMASVASGSDHVDHVRTQAPYAALAMVAALVCGYFPAVILGLPPLAGLALGAALLALFVRVYGRRVEDAATREGDAARDELAAAA